MEDNIYIKSIRFGLQNIRSGVSYTALRNHINNSEKAGSSESKFEEGDDILIEIFLEAFSFDGTKDEFVRNLSLIKKNKYHVKLNSYMHLLEHDKFNLALNSSNIAIKNAEKATRIATWSIVISGLIGITSVVLSIIELTH